MIITGVSRAQHCFTREDNKVPYHWEAFPGLNGFYNGIQTLVTFADWVSEQRSPPGAEIKAHDQPPFNPQVVDPFPNFTSEKYLKQHHPVRPCYLDDDERYPAPDIYAYPGVPAKLPAPAWGAYDTLEIAPDRCYERFGRFGSYGYSYGREEGGLGLSKNSENLGTEKVQMMINKVDYRKVNWGRAQKRCFDKNKKRFDRKNDASEESNNKKKRLPRSALVLRTWTGYEYSDIQLLTMRAMINELSLKSGGEYDVHLLVHVKDNSLPIWASEEIYDRTLRENVPEEFWDIATLWSEQQMKTYYPGPFLDEDNIANHAGAYIYGVYRAAHFALQWFSQQHQEYDFIWNWEMDLRYVGHYYEFLNGASNWAAKQPRKYMWERNSRFWIPEYHGPWPQFCGLVENETIAEGETPVWGPIAFPAGKYGVLPPLNDVKPPTPVEEDDYEWGVGEAADLITFDPIFDPSKTKWVFRNDVTGYDTAVDAPPRRASIVTAARLSRRLLNTMHEETWRVHHTMFPEMWATSIAYHHGYKALYAPHPVYLDRDWPLDVLDKTFNKPLTPEDSPFAGQGEHNMQGSTFYYNSGFSGALWRRWLGAFENGEGGRKTEEEGTSRMCLRPLLHHPIKHEAVE
ncbi:hypothetical protein F5B22DRAFT_639460 [Xylaria bambusicola]|uniref:uncharacterized protein n=1 Tax=Xylaria bambusicola TaxID=326684 RepID=UPI00200815D3|nr:uncharacterized protein F5B22DRAFT_639460 [Xylaria bambusicola]KAI0506142.1 hypothetical protein F5B22DRAFT_639460 [Xylaria bambusicola]